jgi:type VI secretion system protein ImpB|eukprot:UN32253
MGDFSGDNTEALKPLKDRRFIQIDRDNFNDVLKRMSPSLRLKVDNTLTDDGSQFEVNLNFKSIDDFEPAAVVNQVEPLRKLMETRNKLRDLMTKIDRSEELENVLEEVLSNTASLDSMAKELNLEETDK